MCPDFKFPLYWIAYCTDNYMPFQSYRRSITLTIQYFLLSHSSTKIVSSLFTDWCAQFRRESTAPTARPLPTLRGSKSLSFFPQTLVFPAANWAPPWSSNATTSWRSTRTRSGTCTTSDARLTMTKTSTKKAGSNKHFNIISRRWYTSRSSRPRLAAKISPFV